MCDVMAPYTENWDGHSRVVQEQPPKKRGTVLQEPKRALLSFIQYVRNCRYGFGWLLMSQGRDTSPLACCSWMAFSLEAAHRYATWTPLRQKAMWSHYVPNMCSWECEWHARGRRVDILWVCTVILQMNNVEMVIPKCGTCSLMHTNCIWIGEWSNITWTGIYQVIWSVVMQKCCGWRLACGTLHQNTVMLIRFFCNFLFAGPSFDAFWFVTHETAWK